MMALAIKDLLPRVTTAPLPNPEPTHGTPMAPDTNNAIFGGLELLLKKPEEVVTDIEPLDPQSLKMEAWSQGLMEAELLWQEQKAHDMAQQRAVFEQEKEDLANLLHIALTGQIEQQFADIRSALADTLAEVLEPFLEERAIVLMTREFDETAEAAMKEAVKTTPILKGPKVLLKQLTTCQSFLQTMAKDDPDEGAHMQQDELSLKLDKTVFETRLKPFVAQLREAVQDD